MKTRTIVLCVTAVVVLAAAAAGVGWRFFVSVDGMVTRAIETWGSEITGVKVRVDGVKIELAQGRGTIRGLIVGNPKGFAEPHALKLAEMQLTFDPAPAAPDVMVIKELVLVAPDVVYERGEGGDNLAVIQKNVDAWVAKNAGAPKSGPGRKFIIERVTIKNGRAHFGAMASAAMPDTQLRDVGKKTNGAGAGDVARRVWGAMQRIAADLAARAGKQ